MGFAAPLLRLPFATSTFLPCERRLHYLRDGLVTSDPEADNSTGR